MNAMWWMPEPSGTSGGVCSATSSTITAPHCPYAEEWSNGASTPSTRAALRPMCSTTKNGPAPVSSTQRWAAARTSVTG